MKIASIIRKLILRGRTSEGWFSAESWQTAPDEPQPTLSARRAQHYGLTTEPPDGAELVALGVNAGGTNLVSVAEYVTGEPQIDGGEVLLWSKYGHRIKLAKNGDVIVLPAAGRDVILGDDGSGDIGKIVTVGELRDILQLIKNHVHPETGATTGQSPTLATITLAGSPNVKATEPP